MSFFPHQIVKSFIDAGHYRISLFQHMFSFWYLSAQMVNVGGGGVVLGFSIFHSLVCKHSLRQLWRWCPRRVQIFQFFCCVRLFLQVNAVTVAQSLAFSRTLLLSHKLTLSLTGKPSANGCFSSFTHS